MTEMKVKLMEGSHRIIMEIFLAKIPIIDHSNRVKKIKQIIL